MTEIDQEDEVLAETIPAQLLTMTGADIQWLFASGYGEGPIAIYNRRATEMSIAYEAENGDVYIQTVKTRDEDGTPLPDVTAVSDDDETEYLAWIPTGRGLEFARETLPYRRVHRRAAERES